MFSSTAEAFARTAGHDIDEDITSIQNRQAIQKLVLAGRMGDAIAMTNRLYPGFLLRHPSLHFMLKVRQFIEMVSGNDTTESDVLGQGSTCLTETRFKNASPGTMQDNTTETRTTPSRGTAINSTSAPNSLTFEVDENQMEVDLQSSSSSTTASVPAAQASSSQQISNDNAQHQNGYRNSENGSIQAEGSNTNSRSVMNGNLNNTSHKYHLLMPNNW